MSECLSQEAKTFGLTKKERLIINYFRNPYFILLQKEKNLVNFNEISKEELQTLYDKMDHVIESEQELRHSLHMLDEGWIFELLHVKKMLIKEMDKKKS